MLCFGPKIIEKHQQEMQFKLQSEKKTYLHVPRKLLCNFDCETSRHVSLSFHFLRDLFRQKKYLVKPVYNNNS